MRWICPGLAVVLLVATAVHWMTLDADGVRWELHLRAMDLGRGPRTIGLAILLVPPALLSVGLLRLDGALVAFSRGDIFSATAVARLRDFTLAAVSSSLSGALVVPALSWLLTASAPGGPQIVVQIGAGQLVILVVACVFWVFSNILMAARQVAEENLRLVRESCALAQENAQFV